jgi:hypothetical protein
MLRDRAGRFLCANLPIDDSDWRDAVADPGSALHRTCVDRVSSQLGDAALLAEFDTGFDPFERYPFNSGLFASSRDTIPEAAFAALHARERAFFEQRLETPFDWRSHRLFFGDQGRLNYLVDRLGIERHGAAPYGHYAWGGLAMELPLQTVLDADAPCNFVHWAGTPRPSPSLFCRRPLLPILTIAYPMAPGYRRLREIPAYSVWRHFATSGHDDVGTLRSRIEWTWRDASPIPRRSAGRVVRALQRKLRPIRTPTRPRVSARTKALR